MKKRQSACGTRYTAKRKKRDLFTITKRSLGPNDYEISARTMKALVEMGFMWKLKNEEEVKKIRQRKKNAYKKIWRPFYIAVFLFLFLAIDEKIGFPRTIVPWFHPITWKEFFDYGWLKAFWIALFFFAVFYLLQIVSKNLVFSGPDSMICVKCEKLKNDDKTYKCPCGGEYVPLDELEWVEERNVSKNEGN